MSMYKSFRDTNKQGNVSYIKTVILEYKLTTHKLYTVHDFKRLNVSEGTNVY